MEYSDQILTENDVKAKINQMAASLDGIIMKSEDSTFVADVPNKSLLLGSEAFATGIEQIVLAAGKDNQLRFNPDGTIEHNETIVTDSKILPKLMARYMINIVNELERMSNTAKLNETKEKSKLIIRLMADVGFIFSLGSLAAIANVENAPQLCKDFKKLVDELMQDSKYKEFYDSAYQFCIREYDFSYTE